MARADVQAIYQALLDEINVNLAQFEKIKRFALLPKEMTIEGGELTPTLKIRRKIVEQHWAAVIEQLYAREAAPLLPGPRRASASGIGHHRTCTRPMMYRFGTMPQ